MCVTGLVLTMRSSSGLVMRIRWNCQSGFQLVLLTEAKTRSSTQIQRRKGVRKVSNFGPYDEEDAAEDTDASMDDVSDAWHDARDDCQEEGWYGSDDWGR